MTNQLNYFIYEWRFSALASGAFLTCVMFALNWYAGSFTDTPLPWDLSSRRELLGMVILVCILPSYIVIAGIYGQRKSLALAKIIDAEHRLDLANSLQQISKPAIITFALLGFAYALIFNIPNSGSDILTTTSVVRVLIVGQLTIWISLGILLYIRISCARKFRAASDNVRVDIFSPENLKAFAQIGLIDVLIIAAGLVLSTVQSLDFSFRPDNYYKALIIVIPAVVFLSIYPMWGLHKTMRALKQEQLQTSEQLIRDASKSLEDPAVANLESLLQRRERVNAAPTWPVDVAFLQRLVIYIIIPPLAWFGAAVVEIMLDTILKR